MHTERIHPYPAYRPSGVPWLGDVPTHWEVTRGKAVLLPIDVRSEDGSEELLTVSARRGVVPRESANVTMFKAESYVGYKLCWPGDLVINSLWAWAHGLGVSQHHGIVSSAYGVYRPLPIAAPEFIHLLVRSIPFQWELQVRSKGVWVSRLQLTDEAFLGAPIPLPPLAEQRAIVRYLAHVDRRIRRYVNVKRKLISLLEEERRAVVNEAVTRGLDPNIRLKPSGVEWLGDVPEHWEVPRLRNLGDALIGLTYDPQDLVDEEEGMLVLRASNILNGQLVYGDNVYVDTTVPSKLITQEGDILICSRSGSRTLIGKNARIDADSAGTTFGAFMTVFRGQNNDYLHQVFNSKFFEYQSAAFFTSTINQLTLGILYDMKVPFPPAEERQLILRHLKEATAPIRAAIAASSRQIKLIEEYRTRLIADVVTGKLDVREAAAQLPDEDNYQGPVEEGSPMEDGLDEEIYDAEEEPAIAEEVTI